MPDDRQNHDAAPPPPDRGARASTEARPPDEPPRKDNRERHDDGNQPPPKKGKAWYRRPGVMTIVIAVVMAGVVGGVLAWRHSRTYESTEDAFIDATVQRVSPQIAGRVLRVLVTDNQDVAAGTVLLEIDPADFQTKLEQARAGQAQAEAQVAQAEAQRSVADAQREQARASEGIAAANATNAANDLERFQELRAAASGSVSQQQLDHATAEAASTAAQLKAAQRGVTAAGALVVHAEKQIDAARAAVKSAAAQIAQAELTLSYAQVKASIDGRIARKTVAPGNFVQPGADLMAIVPRAVYITANFKETQLARMRRNQPVKIEVDSYPDMELTGHLDGVQPATGQVFDLLPSQNAAGNWVKVVQRVPVKITIDQIPDDLERRLAPGMSVQVRATVR